MRLKLPFYRSEVSVPAWCGAFAILWPAVFLSFVVHSLVIGGDAMNGKVEAGRYFLWRAIRSQGDVTPYVEVSKTRYKTNYLHGVATIILAVPAFVAIWQMAGIAIRQIHAKR